MKAIQKLKDMSDIVKESGLTSDDLGIPWERLVKGAAQCESKRRDGKWEIGSKESNEDPSRWPCNIVYFVLDAMVVFPPENKDVIFESLCNALVRRTCFVTGAVGMDGCPASTVVKLDYITCEYHTILLRLRFAFLASFVACFFFIASSACLP